MSDLLAKNLKALERLSPWTAKEVEACPWSVLPPEYEEDVEKFADECDVVRHAVVIIAGFSWGRHAIAVAKRMKAKGVVFVYEPDSAILRGVMEQVDFSADLDALNLCILHEKIETSDLWGQLRGMEFMAMIGTHIVEHQPSMKRLDGRQERFYDVCRNAMSAVHLSTHSTIHLS